MTVQKSLAAEVAITSIQQHELAVEALAAYSHREGMIDGIVHDDPLKPAACRGLRIVIVVSTLRDVRISFSLVNAILMKDDSVCCDYRSQNDFGGMDEEQAAMTPKGMLRHREWRLVPDGRIKCAILSGPCTRRIPHFGVFAVFGVFHV